MLIIAYFSDSDSEESQSGKSNLYERMVNQNRFDDETGREQPLDLLIPFDEDTGKKIYMFNNIEIGVDVHNRVKSMQGHKLAAGVRFLNLKIEATLMDSKENIKAKKVRVEKTFGRIQLANLEKPRNWYGPEPCPYMKYLELSLLDEEGYTTIASKPPKGDFADVKSPYEALHLNLRISEVKITAVNEEDKFYLLVDSNYYGPFKSIHIRPMHIIWKKHLFLPIMHFTPFSELNY